MTTYHALQRAQERTGYNIKKSAKLISNAIKRGRSAETFNSIEREYLLHKQHRYGCGAIVHNSYCYIISRDNTCITMYPLPAWFGKKRLYHGKIKIRNVKKYTQSYSQHEIEYDDYQYQVA